VNAVTLLCCTEHLNSVFGLVGWFLEVGILQVEVLALNEREILTSGKY
jgi:hypothetical protein